MQRYKQTNKYVLYIVTYIQALQTGKQTNTVDKQTQRYSHKHTVQQTNVDKQAYNNTKKQLPTYKKQMRIHTDIQTSKKTNKQEK